MKTLLILGSGRCLFDDLQSIGVNSDAKLQDFEVMAVNDAILAFPNVQHFVSQHDELMPGWLMRRKCKSENGVMAPDLKGILTYSERAGAVVKRVNAFKYKGGTSTLYAALCASFAGFERVIICGAPMDASGNFFAPPWRAGHDYRVTDGWQAWLDAHADGELKNTRAMSGHPRELLGLPPREWYAPANSISGDDQPWLPSLQASPEGRESRP